MWVKRSYSGTQHNEPESMLKPTTLLSWIWSSNPGLLNLQCMRQMWCLEQRWLVLEHVKKIKKYIDLVYLALNHNILSSYCGAVSNSVQNQYF